MIWNPLATSRVTTTAATVAFVIALPLTAWATPIIYFTDGSSSGGSGGGGGNAHGGASGGGGGVGSAFVGSRVRDIARPAAPTDTIVPTSTATVANQTGLDTSETAGAATSSSNAFTPSPSTSNTSAPADPLKKFFEDLAVDLNHVDHVGGRPNGTVTSAFDAADVINSVGNTSSTPAGDPGGAPISFGAPESGVVLTAENFPPDPAGSSSIGAAIENPEPATLLLLGTGLLLAARNRILKRRAGSQSQVK